MILFLPLSLIGGLGLAAWNKLQDRFHGADMSVCCDGLL
jgi:hypothetical protein